MVPAPTAIPRIISVDDHVVDRRTCGSGGCRPGSVIGAHGSSGGASARCDLVYINKRHVAAVGFERTR